MRRKAATVNKYVQYAAASAIMAGLVQGGGCNFGEKKDPTIGEDFCTVYSRGVNSNSAPYVEIQCTTKGGEGPLDKRAELLEDLNQWPGCTAGKEWPACKNG